jgi:hypothetical protein
MFSQANFAKMPENNEAPENEQKNKRFGIDVAACGLRQQ